MPQAKIGDTVRIHIRGTLEDGPEFTSTAGKEPHEFTLGQHEVVPGLEAAILGMEEGESQTFTVPPAEAFGEHNENLLAVIDRADIPGTVDPKVGARIQLRTPKGQTADLTVAAIDGDKITLDGNHPLAGRALTFEVTLVAVL